MCCNLGNVQNDNTERSSVHMASAGSIIIIHIFAHYYL